MTAPTIERPTIERIDGLDGLAAVTDPWDRLQDACPWKHVLVDHRWAAAWWRHFGHGKELHVLVAKRGDRVVGIAPMMLSRGREAFPCRDSMVQIAEDYAHAPRLRWRRIVPIRRVGFLLNLASSNSRSLLLMDADEPAVHDAIMGYWAERRERWDLMMFEGLPADTPVVAAVKAAAGRAGFRALRHGAVQSLGIAELGDSIDDFMRRRSRHFRKRIMAEMRRCAAAGPVDVVSYRGPRVDAGMDLLFGLELASAKQRPGEQIEYVGLDECSRGFYRAVAAAFGATDQAEVTIMTSNGEPACGLLSLSRQGTLLFLLTYMADRFRDAVTSAPLYHRVIEQAIERGIRRIDVHGNTAHARKWSTAMVSYQRVYVFHGAPYSRVLGALKSASTWAARFVRGEQS